METIELPGYTANEKQIIAKQYLIPRQLKENGLKDELIDIKDKAIDKVISEYTPEAGVRNLERELGTVCRKSPVVLPRGTPIRPPSQRRTYKGIWDQRSSILKLRVVKPILVLQQGFLLHLRAARSSSLRQRLLKR